METGPLRQEERPRPAYRLVVQAQLKPFAGYLTVVFLALALFGAFGGDLRPDALHALADRVDMPFIRDCGGLLAHAGECPR